MGAAQCSDAASTRVPANADAVSHGLYAAQDSAAAASPPPMGADALDRTPPGKCRPTHTYTHCHRQPPSRCRHPPHTPSIHPHSPPPQWERLHSSVPAPTREGGGSTPTMVLGASGGLVLGVVAALFLSQRPLGRPVLRVGRACGG